MFDLLVLVATIGMTAAFYLWRRASISHFRTDAMVLTCLCCLSLGFGLRFGGRTYPGVYFPDSSFLNWLLNGNTLFIGIGYSAVVVAWVAASLHILVRPSIQGFDTALSATKWVAIALAAIIAFYGFSWAAAMQRLP